MVDIPLSTLKGGNHVIVVKFGGNRVKATVCGQVPAADGSAMMLALPQEPWEPRALRAAVDWPSCR